MEVDVDGRTIAGIWNVMLIGGAIVSAFAGWYGLSATILGSMLVTATLTTIAGKMSESIVEALPFLSAFAGSIATVIYWFLKVETWLH